jgi:hypothetical protein
LYTEDAVIKNYYKNNNTNKKPKEKKDSRLFEPNIKLDITDTRNDFSSKHDSSNLSDLNNSITTKQEYCLFSDVKYFIKNITFLLTDDDLFDAAMKEYINVNDFPTDNRDKLNFLKKIIPIYKKIRENDKIDLFISKVSDKLIERKEDVGRILEIMYIKEKRERLITNINKQHSKFILFYYERIIDYSDLSRLMTIKEFAEKFKPIQDKIDQFLRYTSEIK